MADWRVNEGLMPLIVQMRTAHGNIVIGTIGDAAHRGETSDHNPNAAGRVNAADFMLGTAFTETQAVALLPWLVRDERTHYVIHDRKIWTSETRAWLPYAGTDPHTNHIHLSVKDSAHTDTKPWVIAPPVQEDNVNVDDLVHNTAKTGAPAETPLGHWALSQTVPNPLENKPTAFWQLVVDLANATKTLETKVDKILASQPPA